MKKLLFALSFLFCSISLFGQFSLGAKVGINLSKLKVTGTTSIDYEVGTGIDLGGFFRIGKSLYIQPEFLYSLKTTIPKINDLNITDQELDKIKVHTFDVPILVGYKIYNGDDFNFRIFLGPRFGFGLSDNFNETFKNIVEEIKAKKFDFAGQVGAGFDLWRLTFDFIYDYTFTNGHTGSLTEDSNIKTHFSCYKVCLGFKLIK